MSQRDYGQSCSVASFLDRFSSRWTLLIVRDLLVAPRRFSELLNGLPGIGTNLLSERLRELQALGVVTHGADALNGAPVYTLTDKGRELEPVVLAMASWGLRHLRKDGIGKISRPDLLVVAFRAAFRPEHARKVIEQYEFRIDGVSVSLAVDDGVLTTRLGGAEHPAFIFISDSGTFEDIVAGRTDEKRAAARGLLDIVGDARAYARCKRMFGR